MEKITILGSANAIAKAEQQNSHLLVETRSRKILVDCGNHTAASLGRAGVEINQVTDLILTHFHADHVGSLPLLIMDMWLEKRIEPLTIYGLGITLEKVNQLLNLFDWQKWKNMFEVKFVAIPDQGNRTVLADAEIKIAALPVLHLIPTIGLRFEFASGKVCTYSSDTEPCDGLLKLAEHADILLQESAGPGKGHTSPAEAGINATTCGVNRLILIHYEARKGKEALIAEARSTFAGRVELAEEGMVL
jgi:ribonuclease Z